MKVAVIGLGVMGKNHVRIYKELGVLCALSDVHEHTTLAMSDQYGVPGFSSAIEMLNEIKPDMVSIAVPTPYHLDVARWCAEKGVHALVEKPLSDNLEDAKEIVNLFKERGLILSAGYIERFNPVCRSLKALVDSGSFGQITSVNIKRVGGIPRSADNVIIDLMTHDFDLLLNIFGKMPDRITTHFRSNDGIVDSAQALLDFGFGSATCESNWISPIKVREVHITGTKNYAHADLLRQELTQYEGLNITSTHQKLDVQILKGEPLRLEIEAFINAVKTGKTDDIVTGEQALKTLQLTLEAAHDHE